MVSGREEGEWEERADGKGFLTCWRKGEKKPKEEGGESRAKGKERG